MIICIKKTVHISDIIYCEVVCGGLTIVWRCSIRKLFWLQTRLLKSTEEWISFLFSSVLHFDDGPYTLVPSVWIIKSPNRSFLKPRRWFEFNLQTWPLHRGAAETWPGWWTSVCGAEFLSFAALSAHLCLLRPCVTQGLSGRHVVPAAPRQLSLSRIEKSIKDH